jgi:hypothetical protein
MGIQIMECSSRLGESNDFSVLPEAFSAEEKVVLADQTDLASASSALSAVLSEFTRVGSPEKVGHVVKLIFNIYIKVNLQCISSLSICNYKEICQLLSIFKEVIQL